MKEAAEQIVVFQQLRRGFLCPLRHTNNGRGWGSFLIQCLASCLLMTGRSASHLRFEEIEIRTDSGVQIIRRTRSVAVNMAAEAFIGHIHFSQTG